MTEDIIKIFKDNGYEAEEIKYEREHVGPIWTCKIGLTEDITITLPSGSDLPMRLAVQKAFKELTGRDCSFNFSGWGGELDEYEKKVI